jgi:flagellar protein FliO/FliZ
MADALYYLAAAVALVLIALAVRYALRAGTGGGGLQNLGLFGPKPYRRLGVVEHQSVDGKRRLVLIRRDDVEHLIMTGGPVDMVIETGIMPHSRPNSVAADLAALTDEPFPRDPPSLSGMPNGL